VVACCREPGRAPQSHPISGQWVERGYGIILNDCNYVHFEGLVMRNFAPGGVAFLINGSIGVTLRKMDISEAGMGVMIENAEKFKLLESDVYECGENVMLMAPTRDILIADNHIHHSRAGGNCIDLYDYIPNMVGEAKVVSVEPAGAGLARFTSVDLPLNQGFKWGMKLYGQNEFGKVDWPCLVSFFTTDGNPSPDGPEIAGGTFSLKDGRKWFVLRNNPEWAGKPYSPDGKQGLFETGQATMDELAKAKYVYLAQAVHRPMGNRDVQILRNEIDHSGGQGILSPGVDGILIKDNRIHHSAWTGIQIETGARNIWIEGNVSYANCNVSCTETGMWIDEIVDGVVQNNKIYENNRSIMVSQAQWVIARRNLIYNNRGQHVRKDQLADAGKSSGGFAFRGCMHRAMGAPKKTENCAFVHNTVYNSGATNSVWGTIASGIGGYPKVGANVLRNNLIQKNLCPITLSVPYSDAPVLDGNIYSADGPVLVRWAVDKEVIYSIGAPQGLADYQKATGQDAHSLVAEVAFADPGKGDFRLAKDSVAIDKGQSLARAAADGAGQAVAVDDIRCFSAGFRNSLGERLIPGDEIMVGQSKARVVEIRRAEKILVVDQKLTWRKDDPVGYVYAGTAPDAGALEYQP
jgi:hypothetical protein